MRSSRSDPKAGASLPVGTPPPLAMSGMLGGTMTGSRGVPLSVPLSFLLTGAGAAALFGLLLPVVLPEAMLAPSFPQVLAVVHIVTLGWLTMIIIGASLQLTPVITAAPLRVTRFLHWQYPVYGGGVALLVCGFWWMIPWLIATGGSLVVLAVAQYTAILSASLARAPARPLTIRFLSASLIALCLVVSLGLTMAFNVPFGFLGTTFQQILLIHLVLGIVGWLSNTLIGVSYTLGRMFALVHGHRDTLGHWIFLLLNASIAILAAGIVAGWFLLVVLGGGGLCAATWLFAYDFLQMVGKRRRRVLDVTQYHSIAAVVYFSLVMPAGIVAALSGEQQPAIFAALGLAAFVGWLGQSTIGYLYKIVPFLVWQHRYGPLVGHQKVPLMRELLQERWAWISWWLINGGLLGLVISLSLSWVLPAQGAGGLLGAGFVLAALNVSSVVRHLCIPKNA